MDDRVDQRKNHANATAASRSIEQRSKHFATRSVGCRWLRAIGVAVGALAFSGGAAPGVDGFQVPITANNVRLQEYVNPADPGLTLIWSYPPLSSSFPGGCQNLQLPTVAGGAASNAPEGQRSRFFALFMLAKTMNKPVFVTYDNALAPNCIINGFWADPW